jgi:hypothetical protein
MIRSNNLRLTTFGANYFMRYKLLLPLISAIILFTGTLAQAAGGSIRNVSEQVWRVRVVPDAQGPAEGAAAQPAAACAASSVPMQGEDVCESASLMRRPTQFELAFGDSLDVLPEHFLGSAAARRPINFQLIDHLGISHCTLTFFPTASPQGGIQVVGAITPAWPMLDEPIHAVLVDGEGTILIVGQAFATPDRAPEPKMKAHPPTARKGLLKPRKLQF